MRSKTFLRASLDDDVNNHHPNVISLTKIIKMGNSCDLRLTSVPRPVVLNPAHAHLPWKMRSSAAARPVSPRRPPTSGRLNTLLDISQAFLPIVDFLEPVRLISRAPARSRCCCLESSGVFASF